MKALHLLVCASLVYGLGFADRAKAAVKTFSYTDKSEVKRTFVAVVREYYKSRTDGKLMEPQVEPERVRFVFQYDKERKGVDCEWAEVVFRERSIDNPSASLEQPQSSWARVFSVKVSQPRPGSDKFLADATEKISQKLVEALKRKEGNQKEEKQEESKPPEKSPSSEG